MNSLELKMVDALKDMQENHHVIGVKAEFEAEGTRLEEALRLKEVISKVGFDLTIKVGGCEAIKDMYDARSIGVSTVVAPMIETPYAMQKYVNATRFIFPKDEHQTIKFLVNIETITGYKNLDDIINSPFFSDIAGVVMGRVDMTGSMGIHRDNVNCDEILDIAKVISEKIQATGKDMVIGGGVSAYSLPFFKQLPYLTRFETRKIIFDAQAALKDKHADRGILKAVGFELMWLRNKREFYGMIFKEDEVRLNMLETRYKALIEEAGGMYA